KNGVYGKQPPVEFGWIRPIGIAGELVAEQLVVAPHLPGVCTGIGLVRINHYIASLPTLLPPFLAFAEGCAFCRLCFFYDPVQSILPRCHISHLCYVQKNLYFMAPLCRFALQLPGLEGCVYILACSYASRHHVRSTHQATKRQLLQG